MPKNKEPICPLLKKPCLEHGCEFYVELIGQNPNSGQPVHQWDCSIKWWPILMCEMAQKTNQTGAAIESFRNEVVRQNDELVNSVNRLDGSHAKVLENKSTKDME